MTHDANTVDVLHAWWDRVFFPGKGFCALKENGELVLRVPEATEERVLAVLTPENADDTVGALVQAFAELEARVAALRTEWEAAEDKLRLAPRLSQCREQLLRAGALGDFPRLMQQIESWEAELEQLETQHYQTRLALVERAEALAESENWKEATQVFRELGEQWRQAAPLTKKKTDELWRRLETARNTFFDRKRRHQEQQEKEMLHNLDLKMEMVEKAEALAASERWKEATDKFHELLDQWKATGRTVPDKNEELWHRFITAKQVFFERKKRHFEAIQQEHEANYIVKLALVEQAESLKDSQDWTATAKVFHDLMDQWKRAGRVAADKADELWSRLVAAKEHFFQARRQHFETVRNTLSENLARKKDLLAEAETLQHSDQWHEATIRMNALMTEWKQIGPVPREHSDALWQQFIAARSHFFKRKDEHRERRRELAKKHHADRVLQTERFLQKLQEELREEEERLADFRNGINDITPGHKEEELRNHLQQLIRQSEQKMLRKQEKIREVQQQLDELTTRTD
jgi:hypothetical protein